MATLHGILAELGLENPIMHPEREPGHISDWIVDQEFVPLVGNTYELVFGSGDKGILKNIRIDGTTPDQWIDLGEGKPLDPALHAFDVKAYRQIG